MFNSCNGLTLASTLINLGLTQVVVMREPIHNTVAQKFLVQFLQGLATHRDVHEAMIAVVQEMKLNNALTFPSAYLIPSLFRHREAALFRIKPWGLKQFLRQLLPKRKEAVILGTLLTLSLLPPIQALLIEPRLAVQALYRHLTQQMPKTVSPPVLLVQIDSESLRQAQIKADKINPLDRRYLGHIVQKISVQPHRVIGIDYLLDRPTPEDPTFLVTIRTLAEQGIWPVLASSQGLDEKQQSFTGMDSRGRWSLSASIDFHLGYMELPSATDQCPERCPFAYVLAMIQTLNRFVPSSPAPKQHSPLSRAMKFEQWRTQMLRTHPQQSRAAFWNQPQFRLHPVTVFSQQIGQLWLQPILDFSVPPTQVYEAIPAWQMLETSTHQGSLAENHQQIVILASGGYEEADDNFAVPLAIRVWQQLGKKPNLHPAVFTGSEYHAYMVHHLLSKRLVMPIPDLWMIGIAVLLGKGVTLGIRSGRSPRYVLVGLWGGTLVYGIVSLQVYVSSAVLLPWLLPSLAVWGYVFPALREGRG
ncbi:MAG: CHASE2 domain-containing protein [Acaryochloris sp. CRU_2_0]|nr:CHASE2 domain-containing protein [Acaryochloris sp. CRU_2_0]